MRSINSFTLWTVNYIEEALNYFFNFVTWTYSPASKIFSSTETSEVFSKEKMHRRKWIS